MEKSKIDLTNELGWIFKSVYGHDYRWRFTDEERTRLKECLLRNRKRITRPIDWEERVNAFISTVELQCHQAKIVLDARERHSVEDIHEAKIALLKSCKQTSKMLYSVIKGHRELARPKKLIDAARIPIGQYYNQRSDLLGCVKTAQFSLLELIRLLESDPNRKPKVGRPESEAAEFIRTITISYRNLLGRPTNYKDGAFTEATEILLEVIGLPLKAEAILKTLKTHPSL